MLDHTQKVSHSILNIDSQPIGKGRERTCYVHPEDPLKLIKISGPETNIQSRREIDLYLRLAKRRGRVKYSQIPNFYGLLSTNLGEGVVVDLIRDQSGEISKSLHWYLQAGRSLGDVDTLLENLKTYLLDELVIFNHDVVAQNILVQKLADDTERLVLIDGLGDVVSIQWLNYFPGHVRAKINRRWQRFYTNLSREFDC